MVSPRNIRLVLAIIVVTATIGIVAAISQKASRPVSPESVPQNIPNNIDLALKDARYTEMRNGTVVWVLVADNVEYDKTGESARLNGIKMDFTKTSSAGAIKVTADKGTYYAKTKNVKLSGNVKLVTEDGAVFDTDSIDYVAARSSFVTSQLVKFRHNRLYLTARGFEMNVDTQQAVFHKPVDAVVDGLKSR